jgi:hypothetical protein
MPSWSYLRTVHTPSDAPEIALMSSAGNAPEDGDAFRLTDALVEKPLIWSRSTPAPSGTPVLSFVMFRAFVRALKQYTSLVLLLRSDQW